MQVSILRHQIWVQMKVEENVKMGINLQTGRQYHCKKSMEDYTTKTECTIFANKRDVLDLSADEIHAQVIDTSEDNVPPFDRCLKAKCSFPNRSVKNRVIEEAQCKDLSKHR